VEQDGKQRTKLAGDGNRHLEKIAGSVTSLFQLASRKTETYDG